MSDEQERVPRWEHVAWCKARAAVYLDQAQIDDCRAAAENALARGMKTPIVAMHDDDRVAVMNFRW